MPGKKLFIGKKKTSEPLDCLKIFNDVQRDLQNRIQQHQAEIRIGPLPQLNGYGVEFRVLFQNLISNAIKFRHPERSPKIAIHCTEEEDFWKFSVADNGIGIPPKNRQKIFELFKVVEQLNNAEGLGIGLAHCKKIVQLHKGTIWVVPNSPYGSIFYLTIAKDL